MTLPKEQLREQIEAIKRRAITKFHNDHADGDIAIYDVVREMTELFTQYGLSERLDELEMLGDYSMSSVKVKGRHKRSYDDRIAYLKAELNTQKERE